MALDGEVLTLERRDSDRRQVVSLRIGESMVELWVGFEEAGLGHGVNLASKDKLVFCHFCARKDCSLMTWGTENGRASIAG